MIARPIKDTEVTQFDDLAQHYGTLFQRSDWVSLFADKMQRYGVFNKGGDMVGGFTLYHDRYFGMKMLRWAPFTPTCGPFMQLRSQNTVAILEERRAVVEAMSEYLDALNPAICMIPLCQSVTDPLPFFWRGYKVIPNYTYILDLEQAPEQIKANMSPERRKNITKANKDGIKALLVSDMTIVRELVRATFDRQDKRVDVKCLDAILFGYAKQGNYFAYVAYQDCTPIACNFIVHDNQTAYYLMGGYKADEKHHGAGASAMLAAIKHAQEIGLRHFDFEGSVVPAIERYFRGFGGVLTPYYTINKARMPFELVLKFLKRNVF